MALDVVGVGRTLFLPGTLRPHMALDVVVGALLVGHDLLLSAGRSLVDRQLPVPG